MWKKYETNETDKYAQVNIMPYFAYKYTTYYY